MDQRERTPRQPHAGALATEGTAPEGTAPEGTDLASAISDPRLRVASEPLLVEVDPRSNLTDLVLSAAEATPDRPLYRRPRRPDASSSPDASPWEDVSGPQFLAEVSALAKGLIASGVGPGDRVAIMAATSYEWSLTDAAVWFAGAVGVPVYETSSRGQAHWILQDSGAVAAVAGDGGHRDLLEAVRHPGAEGDGLPDLAHVWTIADGDLDALAAPDGIGAGVDDAELEARRGAAGLDDPATIIYTSGTTGRPKGAVLTHGNFVVLTRNAVAGVPEVFASQGASTLLFLPLAHVFARFIEVLCWVTPVTVGHAADVKNLTADLATFKPSFILAVPRVFEKVYNSAEAKATAAGRGRIFSAASATAIAWSRAQDTGGPSIGLRLRHAVLDRLVYGKLRAALGGNATYAVSGGAPLSERLGHFFRGAGITVLQGYGLTETTAPTAVNRPGAVSMATVGPPLPGCSIAVTPCGEVLVAGPHVTPGYHRGRGGAAEDDGTPSGGSAASADPAFAGGWFATGDLGSLDDRGYLTITGRTKDLIVTAGGKNISPAALEDPLRAHPLVSQAVVVGDGRPYVAALLTLDAEMLPTWLTNRGMPRMEVSAASTEPAVLEELQRAVDAANAQVSHAEGVKRFTVLEHDLTEAGGQLTPSMKVKRAAVLAECAGVIEEMYAKTRDDS